MHILTGGDLYSSITAQNQERARSGGSTNTQQDLPNQVQKSECRPYNWWLKVAVYSFYVLSSQTAATLLGRQYYDKGGSSKWLATLVQLCGFPILIPYYFLFSSSTLSKQAHPNYAPALVALDGTESQPPLGPSLWTLACVYIFLGIIVAADCYLYSVGLQYLPVSTYSLICASQLAFNAVFSFFLNSQKFTPFILNSLVLLTISSVLLVFQTGSEKPAGVSKLQNAIGFICTLGASAGYALTLSLTQLFFKKVRAFKLH
ncbi:hypothetical protein CDL15_Pgr017659 [Punica granatum]|uniref:Purine permease 10 n=1 Tax=Punica granatum TaxID=22663 RepID=A0A218XQ67_PUNGR|nr:hypothetical protein CDL15_Pgr017659 [Punica granatum]PKI76935.1 hypothetical protein CRG98_002722 [Punica granatum]